jgi:hypothetical protein
MSDAPPAERPKPPAWRTPLLVAACLVVWACAALAPMFHGLHSPDAMKYADAARHFLRGDGLATNANYPRNMLCFHNTERAPAAFVRSRDARYIGYPLLLAGAFFAFGANDATVCGVAVACWVACGLFVYLLGCRLFSEKIGLFAVVLFALQAKTASFALLGQAEPLCMALLLGGGLLLLAERRLWWAAPLAGVAGAFSFFVRQPMYFVTPLAFAGFVSLRHDRRRRAAALAVFGAAACFLLNARLQTIFFPPLPPAPGVAAPVETPPAAASPAPVANASLLERWLSRWTDISALTFSGRFPGHALERSLANPAAGERNAGAEILEKARYNMRLLLPVLAWRTGAPLWMLAFLASAALTFRARAARRLTLTIGMLFAASIGASLLYFVMDRYFQIFAPLMAIVVAAGLAIVLDKLPARPAVRGAAAAVLIAAACFPPAFGALAPFLPRDPDLAGVAVDERPQAARIAELLRAHTKPDDVVFADVPWIVGWYADRPCIWTPLRPADAYEISRWVKVDFLLLTLDDPQGREIWRDWLLSKGQNSPLPAAELGDWAFVAAAKLGDRATYLFRRPAS